MIVSILGNFNVMFESKRERERERKRERKEDPLSVDPQPSFGFCHGKENINYFL